MFLSPPLKEQKGEKQLQINADVGRTTQEDLTDWQTLIELQHLDFYLEGTAYTKMKNLWSLAHFHIVLNRAICLWNTRVLTDVDAVLFSIEWKRMVTESLTLYPASAFILHRRKKFVEVCNNMRVRKWWQYFWVSCSFNNAIVKTFDIEILNLIPCVYTAGDELWFSLSCSCTLEHMLWKVHKIIVSNHSSKPIKMKCG